MRKVTVFLSLLFGLFVTVAFTIPKHAKTKVDPKSESEILELVFSILKTRHINPKKLDDDFSKKLFNTYLDSIDRSKIFLLQADVDEFKKYETKLDDQIKENDLTFFFMTYDRILLRMKEGKEIYTNILKNQLDFTKQEDTKYFEEPFTDKIPNATYAQNKAEQLKNWNNVLKTMVFQESKNIYLAENFKPLSDILNEISKNLVVFLEATNINYNNTSREEILQHYINAILVQFDPHSKYFMPLNRDKYLNKQTGKIIGVGITMNFANGFILIKKMAEGGPASNSKKFAIGDIILKVGEENETPTNVVGFSVYDVTKLLRGKVGTNIKITIKKANGKIEEILLKRAVVSMNDSYVKTCLIKKNKTTYGLVSFPRFYNDFDDEKARNAADDFATELEILKKENAKGLIIDLRNNAGGSVEAAIKIIGNFVTKTPILQIKTKEDKPTILETTNFKKNWDKNVVVLVNAQTASAAEIITAAFKEFNVGVIVGEQTFGKGTIQEFQDLNVFRPVKIGNKDIGAINISTQKFYTLSGKSVQKNGIIPDIIFKKNNNQNREANLPLALLPDEVKPVKFLAINEATFFSNIIKNSQNRITQSETIKRAIAIVEKLEKTEQTLRNIRTLNADKIVRQIDEIIANDKPMPQPEFDATREFAFTKEGQKEMLSKQYLIAKRNAWLEDLKSDYQIDESINILNEMRFLK
jgi:carboxyl-terminal processing protease